MVRTMLRTFMALAVTAAVQAPLTARAAEPKTAPTQTQTGTTEGSVAEREGARLLQLADSESKAAEAERAQAEDLRRQGHIKEQAGDKADDRAQEEEGRAIQRHYPVNAKTAAGPGEEGQQGRGQNGRPVGRIARPVAHVHPSGGDTGSLVGRIGHSQLLSYSPRLFGERGRR